MSTTMAVIVAIATLVPIVVHLGGWEETKAGQIITSVCLDLVGAAKAAAAPKEPKA